MDAEKKSNRNVLTDIAEPNNADLHEIESKLPETDLIAEAAGVGPR